jgi:hypothetical protein
VNLNFIFAPPFMGFAKIPAEIACPAADQHLTLLRRPESTQLDSLLRENRGAVKKM